MLPITIFLLIFCWGTAALIAWCAYKARGGRPVFLRVTAGCFFLVGAIVLVGCLINSTKLFAVGITLPIGLLLAYLSVQDMVKYKWCTAPVQARVKGIVQSYSRRGIRRYTPVFCYQYLGKSYEMTSFVHYSLRNSRCLFEEGMYYHIFVDPRPPEFCVDKRRRPRYDFLLMFFALFFLVAAVALICTPSSAITIQT